MTETAVAFSPGHISGFFDPYYSRDPKKSGSTGAGISISLGVTAKVRVLPSSKQEVNVFINNKPSEASTTKLTVMQLIGDEPFKVDVKLNQSLPVSQGFGMSGAGALSAALATAKLVGLSKMDAIEAAHSAEVAYRTGLGDVVAESFGGIEIRRSPGLPPWGVVEHIPGNYKIVLCVVGDKLSTSKVLSDETVLRRVRDVSKACLVELLDNPSIENLFKLSYRFAKETNLLTERLDKAIKAASNYGMASMCMLGNAVFAVGKTKRLLEVLKPFGSTYECVIDTTGATVLR